MPLMLRFLVSCTLGFSPLLAAQEAKAPKAKAQPAKNSDGDQSHIELEGTEIEGVRRTPVGSIVTKARQEEDSELIKIRDNWQDRVLAAPLELLPKTSP